jgi:uncharacterized transporter YbjL
MAASLLRIHCDTVWLLAFAAVLIVHSSSGVTRTRRPPAFALPLGSGGRPALFGFFLGCFKVSKLLYYRRSDGIRCRFDQA